MRRGARFSLGVVMMLVLSMVGFMAPGAALADHDEGPSEAYFSATGQTVRGGILSYWRHNGGLAIYGYPLTGEITNPQTGVITQYFERAVIEWHEDNDPAWRALLYRLGAEQAEKRSREKPFQAARQGNLDDCTFYDETKHNLCNGFRDYWNTYGGLPVFGFPLSEELEENGRVVQYFERARFEWNPENAGTVYEVLLGRLGADRAAKDKVDTAPKPKPEGVADWDPGLWTIPAPPEPEPPVAIVPDGAPGEAKWIEVDLSDQYMQAWEYDTPVMGTYVSTGKEAYPTPTGYFSVFYKLPYDDMTSGLFVAPEEYYYVEDVPSVMYFAEGGYAIHGTYWHNMFGTPYSRGCVSAPVWAAEWFYNWAPYGVTIWIHW